MDDLPAFHREKTGKVSGRFEALWDRLEISESDQFSKPPPEIRGAGCLTQIAEELSGLVVGVILMTIGVVFIAMSCGSL